MRYSFSLEKREIRGPARLVRATATVVLLVIVAATGAECVDGVATIL